MMYVGRVSECVNNVECRLSKFYEWKVLNPSFKEPSEVWGGPV